MSTEYLVAIAVVILILLIWAYSKSKDTSTKPEKFAGAPDTYAVLNRQLDARRGVRGDGYKQSHPLDAGMSAYHRAGHHLTPGDLANMDRAAWFAGDAPAEEGNIGQRSDAAMLALSQNSPEQTPGHVAEHLDAGRLSTVEKVQDYGTYITDLVVDPRSRDNHAKWVADVKPWSGTARMVDTLEVEDYIPFLGLQRPQAVAQNNPLQLTEVDAFDLAKNKKFIFM